MRSLSRPALAVALRLAIVLALVSISAAGVLVRGRKPGGIEAVQLAAAAGRLNNESVRAIFSPTFFSSADDSFAYIFTR